MLQLKNTCGHFVTQVEVWKYKSSLIEILANCLDHDSFEFF